MSDIQDTLNNVIKKQTEVDLTFLYDLESGMPLVYNTEFSERARQLSIHLFDDVNYADGIADFADISTLETTLKSLSNSAELGNLNKVLFMLEKGVIQVYLKEFDTPIALCFFSYRKDRIARFMLQCERSMKYIFDAYDKEVNALK